MENPKKTGKPTTVKTLTKLKPISNLLTDKTETKPVFPNRNTVTKQKDFLTSFVNNTGLIHRSCNNAGIRYSTYRAWTKEPRFKLKLEEAQQQVNERVEQSLMDKFKGNSPVPEIFFLKSRDERYKQIAVLEGSDEKPIVITHDTKTLERISRKIIEDIKRE